MQNTIGPFEIILAGSGIIFLISVAFVILYFHYNRKMMIKQLEQNQEKLSHQKKLLKNELVAIEKERKRIAQDLHDEIGANLAYIRLYLAQITDDCCNNDQIHSKLENCNNQLNKSIADVRRISHDLLPPTLEMFGIVPALQEYVDKIQSKFTINFSADEQFNSLGSDKSLQLYRVILELIGNAIKHSKGDIITLELKFDDKKRIIRMTDNGIGYNFDEMQRKKGLGLKNIISRLETIDADFNFENQESGSLVTIILNNNNETI